MNFSDDVIKGFAAQLKAIGVQGERVKALVILANLQPDSPASTAKLPLIQQHRLNKDASDLVPLFEHIIKFKWPALALNRNIARIRYNDARTIDLAELQSGNRWRFTVGPHHEMPTSNVQWWKMEHVSSIAFEQAEENPPYADDDNCNDDNCDDENCDDCCCICMSGHNLTDMKACSHRFHDACIREWVRQSIYCPICRADLVN
jgi:hypothetical protein